MYYYYPRRYKGRSPKWSRMYTGPFLITRVMQTCDYVLQKSARSKPFVAHADKLKKCYGETPKSWLLDEDEPSQPTCLPEATRNESSGGRDAEEAEQQPSADGEPVLNEPAEPSPEVNQPLDVPEVQPPVDVDDGRTAAQEPDGRALRDRRRLRRPARFAD